MINLPEKQEQKHNSFLRQYQGDGIGRLADKIVSGLRRLILFLPTGGGKCLGKDTPILMYDGSIKLVQDMCIGDQLIGPDSKPRNVRSICRGREMLYRVTPVKGDPYIVNESHILSLKETGTSKVVNVGVTDYLQRSNYFRHTHKGWRTGVDFKPQDNTLSLDPYFLGLWLGDGSSRGPNITTPDKEVADYVSQYAASFGLSMRIQQEKGNCTTYCIYNRQSNGMKGGSNPILNELRALDLLQNKHIPHAFLSSSRQNRLILLAGIIDTDGYLHNGGYDLVFIQERLAKDVVFLARSLGLAAYVMPCKKTCTNNGVTGDYWRIGISGDTDMVPVRVPRRQAAPRQQKKSVLVTGIKVEPIGVGDYYGFEIDGDHLFLLGDFTVTHNTVMFCHMIARYIRKQQKNVLILVHREELLKQARQTMYKREGVIAEMVKAGVRIWPPGRVHVAMVETGFNRLKKNPGFFKNVGMIVVDECHLDNFSKAFGFFEDVIVIGFSASPISSNKRKPLKDFYQDIVVCCQIQELIDLWHTDHTQGLVPNVTFNAQSVDRSQLKKGSNADGFDAEAMAATYSVGKHVRNTVEAYEKFSLGKKTLIFNCNKDHSRLVNEAFLEAGYNARHLDSDAGEYERVKTLQWFHDTPDAILNNIGILTTGFDEPSIQAIIVNKSTESLPLWLQMNGRGSRPYPGKLFFIIVDMGSNCYRHGDWNESRDWDKIFHHPEIPTEGGIGGVKECPHCQALIPVSSKLCKWCEQPLAETVQQQYDNTNLEFKLFTKKMPLHIDVMKAIEDGRQMSPKAFYPLHQIKYQLIRHYKVENITDEIAYQLLAIFQEKVEEWCRVVKHDYNQWMKEKSAKWLFDELKTVYSYTPPEFTLKF